MSTPPRYRNRTTTETTTTTTTTTSTRTTTITSRCNRSYRNPPPIIISSDESDESTDSETPPSPSISNPTELSFDLGSLAIPDRQTPDTGSVSSTTTPSAVPAPPAGETASTASLQRADATDSHQGTSPIQLDAPPTAQGPDIAPPPYAPAIPHPDSYLELPRTGKYWVVTSGTEVGILTSWLHTARVTQGISGAAQKGYRHLDQALNHYREAFYQNGVRVLSG
ncbi:hypothetical protein V5O48_012481 [Marasmius crinis-equi]|uniref:Ribonuclease H1 N-terminal domain-containing protein n=1 Tax=Marasmius crinis-equi TaxID=585013 RepID=A0ABR3F2R1_9AGAR